MEQLNKYQVSILKQLANSQIKVYCCPSGVPTDLCDDLVTDDFNSILRLVDLGLASDVSDLPKYAGVVKEWEEQGPRDGGHSPQSHRWSDVQEGQMGEVEKLSKSQKAKDARLRSIYNTTLEEQNVTRETQHNACAICRRPFGQFQAYQDHDHKCCPRRLHNFLRSLQPRSSVLPMQQVRRRTYRMAEEDGHPHQEGRRVRRLLGWCDIEEGWL
jgi:hypothetical protein